MGKHVFLFLKDDLYEYNYGSEDEDDYDDQDDETKSPVPAAVPPKDNVPGGDNDGIDDDDSDDSVVIEVNRENDSNTQISRTFFVTLIAGSAVITFVTLMLAFYIYRFKIAFQFIFPTVNNQTFDQFFRSFRRRNKQKMKPFFVSPAAYGPPPVSTSVRSAPIVKYYQQVPTSTKEFLYQQQQLQLQQESETKAPLLT